jgi:hypothetical protein
VLIEVRNTLGNGEVVWVRDFVVVQKIENESENLAEVSCHSMPVNMSFTSFLNPLSCTTFMQMSKT